MDYGFDDGSAFALVYAGRTRRAERVVRIGFCATERQMPQSWLLRGAATSLREKARNGAIALAEATVPEELDENQPDILIVGDGEGARLPERLMPGLHVDLRRSFGAAAWMPDLKAGFHPDVPDIAGWASKNDPGDRFGRNGNLGEEDFDDPFGIGGWDLDDLGDPFAGWSEEQSRALRGLAENFGKTTHRDSSNCYYSMNHQKDGRTKENTEGSCQILTERQTIKGGTVEYKVVRSSNGGRTYVTVNNVSGGGNFMCDAVDSAVIVSVGAHTLAVDCRKKEPSGGKTDSSPFSAALMRNLREMEETYEAREAVRKIILDEPDPALDENARQAFRAWLARTGIELPTPQTYDAEADTPYSIRWSFFRASLEHASERPSLWKYLWARGVPYDPPADCQPALTAVIDRRTGSVELHPELFR